MAKKASVVPIPPAVAATPGALVESPSRGRSLPVKKRDEDAAGALLRTLCGQKAAQIGKELALSASSVRADIAEAKRGETILSARNYLTGIVPKALAVLEAHLEAGDKDVALVVLEGLGLLGKNVQFSFGATAPPGVESFEVFRARVLRQKEDVAAVPAMLAIEGEVNAVPGL